MTFTTTTVFTLLVIAYNFVSYESRTCICAAFLDFQCEQMDGCNWRSVENDKAIKGICRSDKWIKCQQDVLCTQKIGIYDNDKDDDIVKAYDNGRIPSETTDIDWPWDCHSKKYSELPIDVRSYDLVSKELLLLNKETTVQNVSMNVLSLNRNVSVVAFSTVLVLVIGFFVVLYWKCTEKTNTYDKILDNPHASFQKIRL